MAGMVVTEGKDLTRGNILGNLTRLSLPIMLSSFLQTLYNLMDTFWLGKLAVGAREAVSVTGMSFSLVFFIQSFGFGFVVAGTALTARYKGSDEMGKVSKVTGQFVFINLLFSGLVLLIAMFGMDFFIRIMHVPAEIVDISRTYLRTLILSMIFMFFFLSFQSISQGLGDTLNPMLIQVFTISFNFLLDPLLIFGLWGFPQLGVMGAAYATMITRILAALMAMLVITRQYKGILPRRGEMRPDKRLLATILKIGVPASMSQSLAALGFVILMGFVNTFGTAVISVYSIGNRMIGIFMMPAQGIGSALSAVMGQCLGARKVLRAMISVRVAYVMVLIIMGLGSGFMYFYGGDMVKFFINDPEVIAIGHRMFRVLSLSAFIFGLQSVLNGVFNGSGYTVPNMIVSVIRLWGVRIPLTFLMAGKLATLSWLAGSAVEGLISKIRFLEYPYDSLWWSMVISNLYALVHLFIFYRQGKWKKGRTI